MPSPPAGSPGQQSPGPSVLLASKQAFRPQSPRDTAQGWPARDAGHVRRPGLPHSEQGTSLLLAERSRGPLLTPSLECP